MLTPLLQGLRILSVEQYGAGPFGTQFLGDLGADVIKIENPRDGGDVARGVGPVFLDDRGASDASLFFQSFNRNKRSLALNLATADGQSIFQDLARTADGVACNLRGDVPGRLGLTYERLCAANPRIVCAHLTAFGRDGARAAWPGYDYLMQAEAGYFALTGDPVTAPTRFGLSVVDMMTGLAMAFGLVSGILSARSTGAGRDVDVSLFDVALHNLSYVAAWYLASGRPQPRLARSAHPFLTPCQTYTTRDGWIYLMCNKERFWGVLCQEVGHPELADDPRFLTFDDRFAARDLLTSRLDEILSTRTTAQWLDRFGGKVPAAPILDLAEALDNPFVAERGDIQPLEHRSGQHVRLVKSPVRAGGDGHDRPAPGLGEHTDAILADLGYSRDRIDTLRRDGVV